MNAIRWSVFVTIAAVLFLVFYLACSGDSDTAVVPTKPVDTVGPVTERLVSGSGYTGLMGYYSVAAYPADKIVDITPIRTAGMTINVLPFMHGPNGEMAGLEIEILEYEDLGVTGVCKIGVTLKHPYPDLPEFCGFDVMGLFITNGSGVGTQNSNLRYPVRGVDPVLLNADGYSRWMNPSEFTDDAPFGFADPMSDDNSGFIANATINGYRYFADGMGPEQDVADYFDDQAICAQRGLFSYGAEVTRNYQIQFPLEGSTPQIFFNYAVVSSWSEPLPNPPEDIPFDFPPQANAQYPIYAKVTDFSTLYYNEGEGGGDVVLDVEVFDWSNYWEPGMLQHRIEKFVLETEDGLVEGNHWEAAGTELQYLDGDTDISTHVVIQAPGNPSSTGYHNLFLAVEVDSPSGYYQGYGEAAPVAPLAIYLRPTIEIGTCPGAIITGMSSIKGCVMEDWSGIQVYGSGFVDGPDLAMRLEDPVSGKTLYAYETDFVNATHIRTNFDLTNILPGLFDIVCINGCGTETRPPNNLPGWDGKIQVVSEIVKGVIPSTGRAGIAPAIVDSLKLDWNPSLYASSYNIYIDIDPISVSGVDGLKDEWQLLGNTTETEYMHSNGSSVPFNNHSAFSYVVRSRVILPSGSYESKNSNLMYYCGQDFADFDESTGNGLGQWGYSMQNGNPLLNDIEDNGYSGRGFSFENEFDGLSYSVWLILRTPYIPEIPSATKAYLEFNHRHENFASANGYFVGYTTEGLPVPYNNVVEGVIHVDSVADGAGYNDYYSPAIMNEFGYPISYIHNFQKSGGGYWGWYFSKFNLTGAIEDGSDCYGILGMAFSEVGGNHRFELDDCALIVY